MRSEAFKMVAVLTVLSVAAAFGLAQVARITDAPIREVRIQDQLIGVKAVLTPSDPSARFDNEDEIRGKIRDQLEGKLEAEPGKPVFYRGIKDGQVVGAAFKVTGKGYGGNIGIMVGVDAEGKIKAIYVLPGHSETPGLGSKIEEPSFTGQFKGRSLKDTRFKVKKDGGDIDQISGATISPRGVTKAVEEGLQAYAREYGGEVHE